MKYIYVRISLINCLVGSSTPATGVNVMCLSFEYMPNIRSKELRLREQSVGPYSSIIQETLPMHVMSGTWLIMRNEMCSKLHKTHHINCCSSAFHNKFQTNERFQCLISRFCSHRAMVTGVCRLHTTDGKLLAWFRVWLAAGSIGIWRRTAQSERKREEKSNSLSFHLSVRLPKANGTHIIILLLFFCMHSAAEHRLRRNLLVRRTLNSLYERRGTTYMRHASKIHSKVWKMCLAFSAVGGCSPWCCTKLFGDGNFSQRHRMREHECVHAFPFCPASRLHIYNNVNTNSPFFSFWIVSGVLLARSWNRIIVFGMSWAFAGEHVAAAAASAFLCQIYCQQNRWHIK